MLKRIWVGSIAYCFIFFALGADRYIAHRSAEDLGIFYQSIASVFGGFHNTIEGASHFTVHFSPILYLLAPLVWLTHSPFPLIAIQAAANACVAPALFLIARKRVDERTAALIATVAFLYPPLCGVTFTDFHENGLVPAAIVWLLYALDARKFGLALLFALAALSIKEDQALFVALLAFGAFFYYGRKGDAKGQRWAIATLCLSIVTFIGYFEVVRPLAGATGGWHPSVFYTQTKPEAVVSLSRALSDRLGYLLLAFAPLAFLPLRSPVALLAVAPFAEILLSRAPVTYTMGQHYAAVWIPYVLVAFVLGACTLYRSRPRAGARTVLACMAVSILVFLVANPLHPRYFLRMPQARDAQLDAFLARLPSNAEIGTQEEAYTHMGFFPGATLGMEQYPQFALFDWQYPESNWVIRDGPKIQEDVIRKRYRVVRATEGIVLYERIGAKPADAARTNPSW
ncbi:MAG: DUF2079 domain-containing protein [Candidatus Eremiobacteraeota bacterium]|nr:DUF2079 domain-containing protein [Candidatus Eremiobacteraeota bacterium]